MGPHAGTPSSKKRGVPLDARSSDFQGKEAGIRSDKVSRCPMAFSYSCASKRRSFSRMTIGRHALQYSMSEPSWEVVRVLVLWVLRTLYNLSAQLRNTFLGSPRQI